MTLAAPEAAGSRAERRRRRRGGRTVVAASAVALVLAGSTAVVVRAHDGGGAVAAAAGLVPYADRAGGYGLSYPSGWAPTAIAGGTLFSGPDQNAVSVKKVTLAQAVDAHNVDALRAVTDAVLSKPDAGLTMLRSGPATLGGLPGVFYVYEFPDGAGGRGVHSHYFVFSGRDMYTLVMQALPAASFSALAPTFDAVAASFRAS